MPESRLEVLLKIGRGVAGIFKKGEEAPRPRIEPRMDGEPNAHAHESPHSFVRDSEVDDLASAFVDTGGRPKNFSSKQPGGLVSDVPHEMPKLASAKSLLGDTRGSVPNPLGTGFSPEQEKQMADMITDALTRQANAQGRTGQIYNSIRSFVANAIPDPKLQKRIMTGLGLAAVGGVGYEAYLEMGTQSTALNASRLRPGEFFNDTTAQREQRRMDKLFFIPTNSAPGTAVGPTPNATTLDSQTQKPAQPKPPGP
jgi:hypothetical protein